MFLYISFTFNYGNFFINPVYSFTSLEVYSSGLAFLVISVSSNVLAENSLEFLTVKSETIIRKIIGCGTHITITANPAEHVLV